MLSTDISKFTFKKYKKASFVVLDIFSIKYFILDIFNLRELVEWFLWLPVWNNHRGRIWHNSQFRSDISWETFLSPLPSLIVQVHVMILDEHITNVQRVSLLATVLNAFFALIQMYK